MKEIWLGVLIFVGIFIIIGVIASGVLFFNRVWKHINQPHIGQQIDQQYNLPKDFRGTVTITEEGVKIWRQTK